jgi:hypothetical protein
MRRGAKRTRRGAIVWDDRFDGLAHRLGPLLAIGFRLAGQPMRVMANGWFSRLVWPYATQAPSLPLG